MRFEELIPATVLVAACLPLLLAALRGKPRGVLVAGLAGWLIVPFAVFAVVGRYHQPPLPESEITDRPVEVEENGYVSSRTCEACHPEHYATWHASYHRTMTQVATPRTVIGRFDGSEVEAYGETFSFERRGDEFFVNMGDPRFEGSPEDAPRVSRRIVMTTGLHHMQAYWYTSGEGRRIELAPMVHLVEADRWVPEKSTYLKPPTGRRPAEGGQWNFICQSCHATGVQPWTKGTDTIDTKVGEFGIACEACHGPAEEHVRLNGDPGRRYRLHLERGADPSIVNPTRLDPNRSAQVCGQCHAIGTPLDSEEMDAARTHGVTYRPGDDLTKSRWLTPGETGGPETARLEKVLAYNPHFLEERFWSDGMVRVTGREYLGLIASPCYSHQDAERGIMTCLSCHTMHKPPGDPQSLDEWANDQMKSQMKGNEACLECHDEYGADVEAHTFHAPDSDGSLCYNCHMPYTAYGLLKAVRSHTIDSPSVAASLATGRPNACNQCHLDKTLGWTAEHLEEQYGISPPALDSDQRSIAASILWATKGDAGQRALMAWSMGWPAARRACGSSWMPMFLSQLLVDPYDAVRYIAHRSLRRFPGFGDLEYDYVGPPGMRTAAMAKAFEIWRSRPNPTAQTGRHLLIGADGQLDKETWSRLLEAQDGRRVHLEE